MALSCVKVVGRLAGLAPSCHPERSEGSGGRTFTRNVRLHPGKQDSAPVCRVTNDLVRRAWEHRTGAVQGFTRRYGIQRLVYFETIVGPAEAIAREKQIKDYARAKKIAMINSVILSGTT